MMDENFDIEILWEDLLSQQSNRIRAAFDLLTPAEQVKILQHLRRMTTDQGWHPAQVAAARTALEILSTGQK